MILRQFLHTEPVAASYLFGCGGKSAGAVVDPVGDVAPYLAAAEASGMRILYVIDTHVHADHVSTGRALAEAAGAEYVLFAGADAAFPFRGVRDGEVLELGNVAVEVLHTPGHTPEHVSLLVTDRTRSTDPWFVLTGHTLMVGDLGRTELATSAEEGARALFRSAQALKALPDHLEVLPGAYSGSVCGRSLSGKPFSTIGFERRHNRAFRIEDEAEFVRDDARRHPAGAARGRPHPGDQRRAGAARRMTSQTAFAGERVEELAHGIRENLGQFLHQLLQVLLVGFAIGMMRTVVPALAESEFGVARGSFLLLTAFVVAFGVVKGVLNFVAGRLSERDRTQEGPAARLDRRAADPGDDLACAQLGLDRRRHRAARASTRGSAGR